MTIFEVTPADGQIHATRRALPLDPPEYTWGTLLPPPPASRGAAVFGLSAPSGAAPHTPVAPPLHWGDLCSGLAP